MATAISELTQIVVIGTVVFAILIGGYIIKTERGTSLADKEFSSWVIENGLSEFMEKFFEEGVGYMDGVIHMDMDASTAFRSVSEEKKRKVSGAIGRLRKWKILEMWLKEKGLSENYLKSFKSLGVTSLSELRTLKDSQVEQVTQHDVMLNEFKMLSNGLTELRSAGAQVYKVEAKLLSHHKVDFSGPVSYSFWTLIKLDKEQLEIKKRAKETEAHKVQARNKQLDEIILLRTAVQVFTTVLVTGIAAVMFHSREMTSRCRTYPPMIKKSFFSFLTGHNDIPQNTKVLWNWEEPQTVGKTMTFNIRFFHKNRKPYPVSNTDNVTVEITNTGSEVAKTMVLGGEGEDDANLAQVSFTVHKAGDYHIRIMFSARHIKGSPFTKKFEAGPIDASNTGFMNYTSTVVCTPDSSYPLTIEARDSFGNIAAYRADQNNYFKIRVRECGTHTKYVPTTQIFYNSRQKQLSMHIKMERVGCFQATVSYGDSNLKNGDFNILVLSTDDLTCVDKNISKSRNIWYEARLIECNNEKLSKPKKVYIYITPKQLKLKEYFLKIIGKRLFTYRVCPSTKFNFSGFHNQLGCPVFTIDDGAQAPIILAAKDRSIIAATFTKFLLRNIGGSETFQDKQSFFYHEVRTLHQRRSHNTIALKIDRNRMLQSSYKGTKSFDVSDWCKHFEISFIGEEGIDWGGLRREWFEAVCTQLFDPSHSSLFKRLSEESQGLVHPNSQRGDDDTKMFEFAGKIVGKCLYESARGTTYRQSYRQLVKARFSRSFLAQLIGLRVHYKYFETDDPELYKSKIKYIEENDIEGMDLTFSEEEYSTGPNGQSIVKVVDLVHNGSKIPVTNENKLQYLDQLAQYRLANSVRDEIDSFLKGLNELVPDNLLSIFDENELELLLCGMRKYSVADLKQNHVVSGTSQSFRRVLDWFWTIIGSFNDEQMARLLQFATGCSQLPPGGFAELVPKFLISPAYTYNTLPTAHTCFNNLCLPEYDSIEQFHRSILIAINEGNQGFGLV